MITLGCSHVIYKESENSYVQNFNYYCIGKLTFNSN